jgi:Calx-beta domain
LTFSVSPNYAFNLTLSNPSVETVTVKYTTADDTAQASSNYTVANSSVTGTIVNDDLPVISISLTDADSSEPNNCGKFTLTRTGITTQELTVNYSISGTATNETDYTKLTGTVTFKAGEDKAIIDVNPIDDNIYEGNETVILTLADGGTTYKLDPVKSAGTVTITDNETRPTISISDANPATGKESDPTAKNRAFTIALSNPSTETITVDYTTLDGTAVAGSDYTATQGKITFNPGETTQTVTATIIDDAIFEDPETFKVKLTNLTNATLAQAEGTATILDDDLPGIYLIVTDSEAAETKHGKPTNPGQFTLKRTGSTTNPLTVKYTVKGSATNSTDYQKLPDTITFAAGSDTASIDINVIDDKIYEGTEKVILNLADSNDYTIVGDKSGTVSIADNDPKITQITQRNHNCLEIEGGTEKSLLKFTKMAHEALNKSEICAFVVDDEQGRIGGIKPGEAGYLAAALDRSQIVFSNLGNNPQDHEFDRDSQRYLNFTPGERVHFALIADDTVDKVKAALANGKPTSKVLFSQPETQSSKPSQ